LTSNIVNKDVLVKIARKIKNVGQGIPTTKEGEPTDTYVKYLSLMYDPVEADFVQHLDVFPKAKSVSKLAKQLGKEKAEIKAILEPLVEKGFIMKLGNAYAIPMPLFIYDMPFIKREHYEGPNAKDFAELSRIFFEKEEYYKSWQTNKKGVPRSRILTVSEKIEPEKDIIPLEEVYSIIDRYDKFAIVPCPCRKRAEVEGIRKCTDKYPILNCVILGNVAEASLSLNDPIIRSATKQEVIQIVKEASDLGLVHTTDNYAPNSAILCSCCECCCGLLAGLTRPGLDNPRTIAKANYVANIDEQSCTACGTCLERCKFNAIEVDDFAHVDKERCMGCGLCAVTCPSEAITMKRLEREVLPGVSKLKQ